MCRRRSAWSSTPVKAGALWLILLRDIGIDPFALIRVGKTTMHRMAPQEDRDYFSYARDDLAVSRLEVEPELAGLIFADHELGLLEQRRR
jgi:hypothetical protein